MSVLIEGTCVVIPLAVIAKKHPRGLPLYATEALNACKDHYLQRIAFLDESCFRCQMRNLRKAGYGLLKNGLYHDFAVVDQHKGILAKCSWLEFRKNDNGDSICWLDGTDPGDLFTATRWSPTGETSLYYIDAKTIAGKT